MSSKETPRVGFGGRIGRWLGRMVEPSRNRNPDLVRMSDRELNDLGIGRGEIGRWSGSGEADPRAAASAADRCGRDGCSGRR